MSWQALVLVAAAASSAVAGPPDAVAHLTRNADPVAFWDADAQVERHLFQFDKMADLRPGDGLRQGPAGASAISFEGDYTYLRHFGETDLIVESPGTGYVLRYKTFRRIHGNARDQRLTLVLTPDLTLRTDSRTSFRITRDDRDHRVRIWNAGPAEMHVEGPLRPGDVAAVAPGTEAVFPLLTDSAGMVGLLQRPAVQWQGRTVRAAAEVTVSEVDGALELKGEGDAIVGGARIRVPRGRSLRIWTPRR